VPIEVVGLVVTTDWVVVSDPVTVPMVVTGVSVPGTVAVWMVVGLVVPAMVVVSEVGMETVPIEVVGLVVTVPIVVVSEPVTVPMVVSGVSVPGTVAVWMVVGLVVPAMVVVPTALVVVSVSG